MCKSFKGARKLYFINYSCLVNFLFNADLCKPALATYSFENLVFRLSVFCIFCLFSFELDLIFIDLQNCLINVFVTKCSLVLFSL